MGVQSTYDGRAIAIFVTETAANRHWINHEIQQTNFLNGKIYCIIQM